MATLVNYKGLEVLSPDPSGDGGLAIQDDFKNLVDWNPKSALGQTTDPGIHDDSTADYQVGSLWLRTDTTPAKLFICKDNTSGAAVWLPVLLNLVQDSSPKLGGDLDVNGHKFNFPIGIGTAPIAQQMVRVIGTLSAGGQVSQAGLVFAVTGDSTATFAIDGISAQVGLVGGVTCATGRGLRINDAVLGMSAVLTIQCGVDVVDQTKGSTIYGIRSQVSSGTNKYNIFASGAAQNHMAGNLLIGTTDAPPSSTKALRMAVSSTNVWDRLLASVSTTNASQTIIATLPVTDKTYFYRAVFTGCVTGGSSGTIGDVIKMTREYTFKSVSGTVTQVGTADTIGTDIATGSASGASVTMSISSTNIRAQVTGNASVSIDWSVAIEQIFVG